MAADMIDSCLSSSVSKSARLLAVSTSSVILVISVTNCFFFFAFLMYSFMASSLLAFCPRCTKYISLLNVGSKSMAV